jgi:fructan beta-fructosidase
VNPRGSFLGSGTMYFIGNFDGQNFTADPLDYPIWFDYGMDSYAGVSYSNTGDRKIIIAWMNNWSYAPDVPVSPWRSAMSLPRELKLIEYEGKPILASTVVDEIDKIAGPWKKIENSFEPGDAYQLRIKLYLNKNSKILLKNNEGERFIFEINSETRKLIAYRNAATGQTSFNAKFPVPSLEAPLNVSGDTVTFNIFVDQSSIEIFTENGSMSMTNLIFPASIYNSISVYGVSYKVEMRNFTSIWRAN